jgi:hypothetical protein
VAGDPFKKVMPGDRLAVPAEVYNALQEALQKAKAGRFNQPASGPAPRIPPGCLWVRNDGSQPVDRFGILALRDLVFNPSTEFNTFAWDLLATGDTPGPKDAFGHFAVLQQPLAAGQVGVGMVDGVTPVLLNVTHEQAKYADIDCWGCCSSDAIRRLRTCECGGARILAKAAGTGERWGIVKVGVPTDSFFAKITAIAPHWPVARTAYTVHEVHVDLTTGLWVETGSGIQVTAWNTIEESGLEYADTAHVGEIVQVRPIQKDSSTPTWWFTYEPPLVSCE